MSARATLEAQLVEPEELALVPTDGVRARRRPRALVTLFVWEATLGLILGSSLASVAGSVYARHPDGDDPLFAAGGLPLLDLLRHSVAARGPILDLTLLVLLAARMGGLFPAALAMAELAFSTTGGRAPRARDVANRAIGALPATISITLLALALQAALLLVGLGVASAWAGSRAGEPHGDQIAAGIALVSLLAVAWTGVGADVARAVAVRDQRTGPEAIRAGVALLLSHPLKLPWSCAWRSVASLAPVGMAAALTSHVAGRGTLALVVIAAVHQLVIAVRVAIRASWMSRTLRALP